MNIQYQKFKKFNMYQLKPIPFNPLSPKSLLSSYTTTSSSSENNSGSSDAQKQPRNVIQIYQAIVEIL